MRLTSILALAALSLSLLIVAIPGAQAVITGQIDADISHPFLVGNTTLPPGHYQFRMAQGSGSGIMTVQNADRSMKVQFMVRPSMDDRRPQHSELVFERYGQVEILKHVYEAGAKTGVTVIESSHQEARLQKQGRKPVRHTEEQKQ